MTDVINLINNFAWIGSNVLIAYIAVVLVIFVIGYFVLYDPYATTGGKLIFRFMLSLVGVILLVFVSTFIDPSHNRAWLSYPNDVSWWRPIIRFGIYAYVAFTTTSLSILLMLRKWCPNKVKKASDLNLLRLRHTGPIKQIDKI